MADIVEFLTARYDDEERAELARIGGSGVPLDRLRSHVLTEVADKRAIMRDLQVEGGVSVVLDIAGVPPLGPGREAMMGALRLLAIPYAGHPDYDPEWAVEA